ncbi:hypothetical protein FB451DRAFT_1166673 [Mycena latifolia]|nr:hypothetical protein FB451DRAFT_1166673 [Mycena latifolia]
MATTSNLYISHMYPGVTGRRRLDSSRGYAPLPVNIRAKRRPAKELRELGREMAEPEIMANVKAPGWTSGERGLTEWVVWDDRLVHGANSSLMSEGKGFLIGPEGFRDPPAARFKVLHLRGPMPINGVQDGDARYRSKMESENPTPEVNGGVVVELENKRLLLHLEGGWGTATRPRSAERKSAIAAASAEQSFERKHILLPGKLPEWCLG